MIPAGSAGRTPDGEGPEISVILPAYNEAPVIARSVTRVDSFLRDTGRSYEILLGDDGSSDATIPNALATGCAALRVIAREHGGKGAILTASLADARGDYVGFIDADLEIDIAYLTEFLGLLDGGADAVIARKTDPLEAGRRRPLRRRVLTFLYNAAARTLFGTPYRDHQAGMKFFRRSLLQRILPSIRSHGWIWDTEVLVASRRAGATVAEVPIVTLEVPGRIPKVSWLSTSLAMSRELLILRSQVGRAPGAGSTPVDAQGETAVAAGIRSR